MGHYRTGIIIVLVLAVLTIVEFYIAIMTHSAVFLLLIAALKAVLVIWFFMHVKRLWAPEESH
jgi:heme/copper-type cytochrome/quinol oxidase subunit 4